MSDASSSSALTGCKKGIDGSAKRGRALNKKTNPKLTVSPDNLYARAGAEGTNRLIVAIVLFDEAAAGTIKSRKIAD